MTTLPASSPTPRLPVAPLPPLTQRVWMCMKTTLLSRTRISTLSCLLVSTLPTSTSMTPHHCHRTLSRRRSLRHIRLSGRDSLPVCCPACSLHWVPYFHWWLPVVSTQQSALTIPLFPRY